MTPMLRHSLLASALLILAAPLLAAEPAKPDEPAAKSRPVRAKDVFASDQRIIFQDDFRSGSLARWNYSEDDRYGLPAPTPTHIQVVDAPKLGGGAKAVRMVVERAPNSFRSEISLPHEKGFQERWYAARLFVPEEWVIDPSRANDIVMQWHAIPGDWRATYPNLEISIGQDRWFIRQRFGDPKTKPERPSKRLDAPLQRGVWVSWVIHAKWSPRADGRLQIWKDGQLVFERPGPNVYGTIGVDYTPYLKTGIYHPEWHTDTDRKRAAFDKEQPVAKRKIIYVTDVKVGGPAARLEDFAAAKSSAR